MSTSMTGTAGKSRLQAGIVDAGRLERLLRLRHQHPRQHAGADRAVALRAEDAGLAGVRPHPARPRPDDVPLHLLLCLARLSPGAEDRPQRRLRAAVGRQRAAHVHRHLRDHAADHAQDRRSDQGLVSRPGLGVLPEFYPDDRRLHRALHPARSRRARRCSARWPASRSPSSRCGRRWRCT